MALDGPGFEFAYRAYAPRLRAVAYAVLHDREGAEDAVHAALARVWSAGTYRPDRGALLSFLIACVRREALDVLRSVKRRADRELRSVDSALAVDDPIAAIDPLEAQRVKRALDALPAAQRDIVVRAYYGNCTLAQIASERGIPLGTVKSRLSAALRALHGTLSEGSR